MGKIKFGTDGWRAVVAKEFTVENVCRITLGVAKFVNQKSLPNKVVIGYDCRFGGELFANFVAKVLKAEGMEVVLSDGFVTTPMISFATQKLGAGVGVIITASHNPPSYNGYKLKGHYGGPLLPKEISEVEELIPNEANYKQFETEDLSESVYCDLRQLYREEIERKINLELINAKNYALAFTPMYGSGQGFLSDLLGNVVEYNSEWNPGFNGISPEPIPKNLKDFLSFVGTERHFDLGAMVDGDADRIALSDRKGNYIDSHHIMLMLIYIQIKKGHDRGIVATGFSSTSRIKKLCEHFSIPLEVVPIGFKHICGLMISQEVIMGGEESGGIAISGHIPERDGIYNILAIMQYLAERNIHVEDLLEEIYSIVGKFYYERIDLQLPQEKKETIVKGLKENPPAQLDKFPILKTETLDGHKMWVSEEEWVMIRPSGTEPLLRLYAEANTQERLAQFKEALLHYVA